MIRVLSRIKSEPWAITQETMNTILEIAQRENESPQAVAAKLGRPLENTYAVEYRDGVAIINATGPMFRYANLFTALSGATSYDLLARDFNRAVEDPRVTSILLNVDSPGGEASGVSEFADQIYAARSVKPVVAYIGGQGASAAYWLASAASEVVISDTALIGSIGVVLGFEDTRERDAKSGVKKMEIVSSQSPYKRLDHATDEGRGRIQARVDSLAEVFLAKVARNRGVDKDTVEREFGQGDIFIGQDAVTAGLADRVGSFEGVVSELKARASGTGSYAAAGGITSRESTMDQIHGTPAADKPSTMTAADVASQQPEAAAALRAEGAAEGRTAERTRVKAILGSDEAADRGEFAQHLAFETDLDAEQAIAMLGKAPKAATTSGIEQLSAAMSGTNPQVGADAEPAASSTNPAGDALVNTAKAMGQA